MTATLSTLNERYQFEVAEARPDAYQEGDTWKVKGLKVFRTGTFKDSKGRQMSWSHNDLAQMVTNFQTLKGNGLFKDIPVRRDHSNSIDSVIGYVSDVRIDGDFLSVDFEFTEPDAVDKYRRGTFRARSAEIAPFETNGADPQLYFPTFWGFAFVDVGAVQGLYRTHTSEEPVSDTAKFRIRQVETADYAAVQAYIDELETAAAKGPELHTFHLPTGDTTDYAAVQAWVDTVQKAHDDLLIEQRSDFVKTLVKDNKMLASVQDATIEFVKGLSPDQYATWQKTTEALAPIAAFNTVGGHGNGGKNDEQNAEAQIIEDHKDTVAMHRRSGMPEEALAQTESFQFLKSRNLV